MSFLTRLAKRYDAVMNMTDGNVLFVPIGRGTTASGEPVATVSLTRQDGDRHHYHIAERESYAGVRAYLHSNDEKKRQAVTVDGEDGHNLKVLPGQFSSENEAEAAATAEFQRVQRNQATISLTLATGRPELFSELFSELPVDMLGWKPEIDETPWLLQRVTHEIADSGYTCSIELEMRDDPATARHRSHFRAAG